jgi:hypothetical protein
MAYQDEETGLTTGRPIELYKFTGTYNSYFLTSYSEPVTHNGQLYTPIAISRNKFKVGTQEQPENSLEVNMPFDHPLMSEYAYQNAPPDLVFTLMRVHEVDTNDSVTLWTGKVTAFSVVGRKGSMKIPALFSYILQGNTPTPRFQAPCNHVLYDSQCGIDPALHQFVTTVVSVSGTDITVDSLPWVPNEGAAGMLSNPSGESRMIMSNAGNLVVISYSFATISPGDTVTLRKGCDHAFNGDCKNKFANGDRFGGYPIVPDRNPFTSSLT